MCIEENCKKIPNYNYENETKGLYCATHKKEYMINVISPINKTVEIIQLFYDE